MLFSKYKYDVFISHAVEDKLVIANELFQRLEEAGLNIWYSGKGLRIGDSIEETIRKNLSLSRYAVVIFSQNYLSKNWTMKELYLLMGHEIAKRKVILPILLDVTANDLVKKDITIADKFAIPVERGLDYIVEKIVEEVRGIKRPESSKPKVKSTRLFPIRKVLYTVALFAALVALSYFGYAFYTAVGVPDNQLIEETINNRITAQQARVEKEVRSVIDKHQAQEVSQQAITTAFNEFDRIKTYFRNEYEFSNGFRESRFRKNVEKDLKLNLDAITPFNSYGFTTSRIYLSPRYRDGLMDCMTYSLINSEPVHYTITDTQSRDNGDYEVTVTYTGNIRGIQVNLIFPAQDFPKRYQVFLKGFYPAEKFIFHREADTWTLNTLE